MEVGEDDAGEVRQEDAGYEGHREDEEEGHGAFSRAGLRGEEAGPPRKQSIGTRIRAQPSAMWNASTASSETEAAIDRRAPRVELGIGIGTEAAAGAGGVESGSRENVGGKMGDWIEQLQLTTRRKYQPNFFFIDQDLVFVWMVSKLA